MNVSPSEPVKYLLVDDLEENLLALEILLRRPDLMLLKATSGRQALELLLVHDVALALIDVQMPEMSGFELAELMRGSSRTRHVPIIFVTAGMSDQHRLFQGYDAGAVDFLFKPIDPHILRNKSETFFRLYQQKQELSRQIELQRQAREERERLTRELEQTLRFNETFVAVVGHDLRSPLNAILMGAEVALRSASEPGVVRVVRQIRSSGQRMRRILDDLADLARVRLGDGIAIETEPADLLVLARKVAAEHQASHPERTIEVTVEGGTSGQWDAPRLEQLLSNLVGNAIRHGAEGSPVRVHLDGAKCDQVIVSVHNLGHIGAELLPDIFHPFRTGPHQRSRSEGLGLGLFIVRQLAIAHGGDVVVESSAERGTTFRAVLPRVCGSTPVASPQD